MLFQLKISAGHGVTRRQQSLGQPRLPPRKSADPKVSVTNVGYSYDPKEDFGTATVVALIDNPSTEKVAVNIDFTAYDKAGKVLAQTTEDAILGSKKTGASATALDVGEGSEIGRVTAEPDVFEHEADTTLAR